MIKFLKKATAVAIATVTMMSSLLIGSVTTASAASVDSDSNVGASLILSGQINFIYIINRAADNPLFCATVKIMRNFTFNNF